MAASQSQSQQEKPRLRRMYAMCPPSFQRIGTECFSLPQQQGSWLEAHFFCKDKNARLAEPEKLSNRKLRDFLLKYDSQTGSKLTKTNEGAGGTFFFSTWFTCFSFAIDFVSDTDPIWIGATYDWVNKMWQWSISGRNVTYSDFPQKNQQ